MVIGAAHLQIRIPGNRSLKGKRKIVKSIINRLKNKFNISISEVGSQDMWQRCEIGISTVSNSGAKVESLLDKVLNFIEASYEVEILEVNIELIHI